MIQIDPSSGLNLRFKVNLTGTTFEQINAWANIEPSNSDVSYQIPASIIDGVLVLKSSLEDVNVSENGQIKIKVQHGNNLHEVWNSEYKTVEKVQIVLEQIKEERKVVEKKKEEPKKEIKVLEKKEIKKVEQQKVVEKVEQKEKTLEKSKPQSVKNNEWVKDKVFKFSDYKK